MYIPVFLAITITCSIDAENAFHHVTVQYQSRISDLIKKNNIILKSKHCLRPDVFKPDKPGDKD